MNITTREQEVLTLVSNGLSSKQIAQEIYLSHHTVNDHLKSLRAKMEANNLAQLVRRGFEIGILTSHSINRSNIKIA
jgi:DNA-binding NarL/FixJ family response regulator